tara:strand:+ start:169 stop:879 length:711 start_codon:yes stop_codon:yes gene_type:complete
MTFSYEHFLEFAFVNRWRSKSQVSQDLFVFYFAKNQKGFFIEIGACDGVHLSNTFLLEKSGWDGIICEPSKYWQMRTRRRNCKISKKAVFSESGRKIKFDEFPTSPELSGFNEYLDDDNNKQLRSKGYKNNAFQSYDVETISLNDLIAENTEKKKIDYISIDTEGSEYEILKNFDFKKYNVEIFTIEHNFIKGKREKIYELLTKNDYVRIFENLSHWDDWYVKKDNQVLKFLMDNK